MVPYMATAMRIYLAVLDKLKIEAIALSLFSMTAESYKYNPIWNIARPL